MKKRKCFKFTVLFFIICCLLISSCSIVTTYGKKPNINNFKSDPLFDSHDLKYDVLEFKVTWNAFANSKTILQKANRVAFNYMKKNSYKDYIILDVFPFGKNFSNLKTARDYYSKKINEYALMFMSSWSYKVMFLKNSMELSQKTKLKETWLIRGEESDKKFIDNLDKLIKYGMSINQVRELLGPFEENSFNSVHFVKDSTECYYEITFFHRNGCILKFHNSGQYKEDAYFIPPSFTREITGTTRKVGNKVTSFLSYETLNHSWKSETVKIDNKLIFEEISYDRILNNLNSDELDFRTNDEEIVYKGSFLHIPAAEGDINAVQDAIHKRGIIDLNSKYNGLTALMYASRENKINVMNYLIKHGAFIDATTLHNETALFWAVSNGHIQAVRILLDYDADTKIKNNEGKTVMDLANELSRNDIIKMISEKE